MRTQRIDLDRADLPDAQRVLTPDALDFVAALHREFDPRRRELLGRRAQRRQRFQAGETPDFLSETSSVRSDPAWRVAPTPADLDDRRVEITGPAERKMMINALNSGARVFMSDFEDALSPTWGNVIAGQGNVIDAVRGTIAFESPEGKSYRLNPQTATLVVRPRGWHLPEAHMRVDGETVSGSLFDFGLFVFHNARELLERGSGPYLYLPKLESHLEARLWNDVFLAAQDRLGVPRGSIRATVLIETILAAFEMEEILYELRDHAAGLNAGRWDYMFSIIKQFGRRSDFVWPGRSQVTMAVPFMVAYTDLLVRTCHARGAHAIGGMAAFVPNRRDAEATEQALQKVREDKLRESGQGFDGTWVAHPDLVGVATDIFDHALADPEGEGSGPLNQKHRLREDVKVAAADLLDFGVPGGTLREQDLRSNLSVALQYINAWFGGNGAAAIFNLMEDAATAEIARSQLWQWVQRQATLDDGRSVTADLYRTLHGEELAKLGGSGEGRLDAASKLLRRIVLESEFTEFMTVPAYEQLRAFETDA
ncbi:MAG: malate synthase A [Chloroflexi bacterium]|nr:MAG: malate synthase A [Chloroflexota bacterium]